MKEAITNRIIEALKKIGIKDPKVALDYPSEMSFGDLSTNVAMVYAKELGKKPLELAEEIKKQLDENKIEDLERVEVIKPGFINLFLSFQYFAKCLNKDIDVDLYSGKKVIIEYTVCNVLKPMHIGHLMGNVIGESLSRIIETLGAEVKRNNYQGDSGLHVAQAVWGIKKLGGKIEGTLSERTKYIGDAYTLGANSYEDEKKKKKEIKEINEKIFKKKDENLDNIFKWGKQISLDHFDELYKKLGTKFDYYFFESEVENSALKVVREFLDKGVFEESDGAVVFKGEKYDPKLHTRVFISSQGIPMYEAKDIAHAIRKYETYKFDKSIIVTANEQSEYFKVVLRALQEISPEIASKTEHVAHGILKLSDGKMSSRKGNTITGEDLIEQVKRKVEDKIRDRELNHTEIQEISEIVAIGAIKYSILRQAIGGDIVFDLDKSISFEGDSGPYLQYSTVRANSVLSKAGVSRTRLDSYLEVEPPSGWVTTDLERYSERFSSVVERAGREYAPHYLVTYLVELAGEFNSFYAEHKIINENDPASPYKLFITKVFADVMTEGLNILGIKVPERM